MNLIAGANNELYHLECPSRKDVLTSCGTKGSSCCLLQGLPLLQLSGQGHASPGAACIWKLQGGGCKGLAFQLHTGQFSKQSSLPGEGKLFIGLPQSSTPYSTQSYPFFLPFTDINLKETSCTPSCLLPENLICNSRRTESVLLNFWRDNNNTKNERFMNRTKQY